MAGDVISANLSTREATGAHLTGALGQVYFNEKEPMKVQIFENFGCSGQNSSNSLY